MRVVLPRRNKTIRTVTSYAGSDGVDNPFRKKKKVEIGINACVRSFFFFFIAHAFEIVLEFLQSRTKTPSS